MFDRGDEVVVIEATNYAGVPGYFDGYRRAFVRHGYGLYSVADGAALLLYLRAALLDTGREHDAELAATLRLVNVWELAR